ncbi:DnaK suppressor protein [Bacillus sp. JCM 19046]|uniref:RNA polymerase-binding protein DksA n=1 Tax=Shouchella xiaoxiensis TaxID=766895 RepID=A0ABS2SXK0_9BACI|nr:TraR/DksA C4-type zinc finger protein [Shouchella xiaoxiensis]MBM7840262.1 RNA polymerase-binding protein DksA [Shouchella xiaoxiensis]GAF14085.1 DnaK suppressor protein [Bacillus sp. JCM 19045]GAF20264.1 DnaK suppressor protein [Bacillus sp. JCM 19046]
MPLTKKQLSFLKEELEDMKASIENRTGTPDGEMSEARGDIARGVDNHIAETASEYEERVMSQTIDEADQERLSEINEALERMEDGSYGICVETGEEIPYERLEALPYAKRTMEAQEEEEAPYADSSEEDSAAGLAHAEMNRETETTRELNREQDAGEHSSEMDADLHYRNEKDEESNQ